MRIELLLRVVRWWCGAVRLLVATLLVATPAAAQPPPPHRAGLVILHGGGQVVTRCVSFTEESITGADLLLRSGLSVVVAPFGGLGYGVCAIDGEGCGAEDCFCQCKGNECAYWVYSHRQPDGSWAVSGVGASNWQVRDGDADGWAWGDGTTAPPFLSFEAICPEGSDQPPAAPPSPTATEPPAATSTPSSSPTPTTSATVAPTVVPTFTPTIPPTSTCLPTVPPTMPPPTPMDQPSASPSPSPANYALFGLLILGLAGMLLLFRLRRR